MFLLKIAFFIVLSMSVNQSWAFGRSLVLTTETKVTAPRWMDEKSIRVKDSAVVRALIKMKAEYNAKNWISCLSSYPSLEKSAPSLLPWVARQRLLCAYEQSFEKKDGQHLALVLSQLEKYPEWLLKGSHADLLRQAWLEGMVRLIEVQSSVNRKLAWESLNRIEAYTSYLTPVQKAKVYRLGGELAFVEQNLKQASSYFRKSLKEFEDGSVQKRLESIQSQLLGKTSVQRKKDSKKVPSFEVLLAEEENKIYQRMKRTLDSKDLVAAVEDGMKLIVTYPGGLASEWAEQQVLRIYLSISEEHKEEFRLLRKRVLRLMLTADADRLLDWASKAFWKSYYEDSLEFAEKAVALYGGQKEAKGALQIAAKSALYIGEEQTAQKWFVRLTDGFAGSEEAKEALFFQGLHRIRQKEYSQAVSLFERLLALGSDSSWEYKSLYWKWRSLQKIQGANATEVAEKLKTLYPLTYYGLRARAELSSNRLAWEKNLENKTDTKVSEEFWLSNLESLAWERFLILSRAGWFPEAQEELKQLPEPQSPEGQVVMAYIWGRAFDYYRAIRLLTSAWDSRPELLTENFIKLGFPKEFKSQVTSESESRNLDPLLTWALIRQESSFRPKVVSSAGAVGLMQLMIPTAKDVADKAEVSQISRESLQNPSLNIKLGTRYLQRLMRAYKGHLPSALAAYNAGIGRMRKWAGSREVTKDLSAHSTSDPFSEVWIDELPWSETSGYVKSVLRNYLIYQMLDKGEIALKDPLWLPADG